MRRQAVAAIAGAVAILIAGCGGGSDETDAGSSEVASPIAEYLGFDTDFSEPEAAQAQFVEEERARREVIARCMREEGFDYVSVDPDQVMMFEAADGLGYGSDEWVAKYGFGITTKRWPQSALGADLVGYEDLGFGDGPLDANQEIVEAMTESERDAYFAALYACGGEAQAADARNGEAMRFYTEFSDELEALYELVQNDPRLVEWEKGVQECVAGQGLEYPGSEKIHEFFEDEVRELDSQITYPGQDLTGADYESMSEEELDAVFDSLPTFTPEGLARIGELQAVEIALAAAVQECDGGFEAQAGLFREVHAGYEQKFLDENTDRLAEFEEGGE